MASIIPEPLDIRQLTSMKQPVFSVPCDVVAAIALLVDDIGYLLETGAAEDALHDLAHTQAWLAGALDEITSKNQQKNQGGRKS